MNGHNSPVGFQGLNIQQPGGQQQFIPNPATNQQMPPGLQQMQEQIQRMQQQLQQSQPQHQAPLQPQPQQQASPQPQQPQGQPFELPVLGIMERVHELLENYRATNEKAYPDDLRNDVTLEINKLRMFRDRMTKIPVQTEQTMQQMFSNNIKPFLERQ